MRCAAFAASFPNLSLNALLHGEMQQLEHCVAQHAVLVYEINGKFLENPLEMAWISGSC